MDPVASLIPPARTATSERLEHFPVGFFAMVMGLGGLTLVALRMEHLAGLPMVASPWLLLATVIAFATIATFYGLKAFRYPAAVRADWNNPVRINFFPAASIGLILIATAMAPMLPGPAFWLWALGSALQLAATLAVASAWIGHRPFEPAHLNPAWFIPAVGNVVVPIAGARFGHLEVSWFFFAVGMVFWTVLLTLVFNRLIFHSPLPARLMPTLMILIAPPAVGFISYFGLVGELDPFARILYYSAVLFALILLMQVRQLRKLPFVLSCWAYSFPLAAFAIASLQYGHAAASLPHIYSGLVLACALAVVIAGLLWRTAKAIAAREICRPEH